MGKSAALDMAGAVWTGIKNTLYPEKPPLRKNGDVEEGGVAAKKETGYGELQRVWRELSPAQIPHLLVITLLSVQVVRTAANGSVVSCTLHSGGVFVIYRDLATGGFYNLAMQALKGQIGEVEQFRQQNAHLMGEVKQFRQQNAHLMGEVEQFKEQNAILTKTAATLAATGGDANKAVLAIRAEIVELIEVRKGLQKDQSDIRLAVDDLMASTPKVQRRRSRSFSGSATTTT